MCICAFYSYVILRFFFLQYAVDLGVDVNFGDLTYKTGSDMHLESWMVSNYLTDYKYTV